jgi:ATP synthase protein I
MNNPDAKRVIRLQVRLTLLAVAASVVIAGPALNVPVSALIGGLCAILPALAYVHIAGAVNRVSPAELMRAHYKAEAVKFVLTLLLFGGALAFFKDLSVAGLFGGYIAATSAYWFGLLIKN